MCIKVILIWNRHWHLGNCKIRIQLLTDVSFIDLRCSVAFPLATQCLSYQEDRPYFGLKMTYKNYPGNNPVMYLQLFNTLEKKTDSNLRIIFTKKKKLS